MEKVGIKLFSEEPMKTVKKLTPKEKKKKMDPDSVKFLLSYCTVKSGIR
jgi:CCR4-NOT transcriptional regulation complex NOT5 subunit